MSYLSPLRKWRNTPATILRPSSVDKYGKVSYSSPENIMVYCELVTTEELSVLKLSERVTHRVFIPGNIEIDMQTFVNISGVDGKKPQSIRIQYDRKGNVHHQEFYL